MSAINDEEEEEVKAPLLGDDLVLVRAGEFVPRGKFEIWNEDRLFGANGRVLRYIALFFICVLTFGSYYVYDTPGAIQTSLESYYDITDSQYALLYSVYSWPNTVIVFFGGYLVDRFGVRLCCLIFRLVGTHALTMRFNEPTRATVRWC
jgi:nitrate/nitrite transporter NarK